VKEHFILSNYLKVSKTFIIYESLFSKMSLKHSYSPIEISTKDKSEVTEDELLILTEFILAFKVNHNATSIVISNPFKQIMTRFCDVLDVSAKQMNSVNLVVKKGELLVGLNMDGEAFLAGQKATVNFNFQKKVILLLGCGGVSTAVAFKLAQAGVKAIHLFDINSKRTNLLARRLRLYFPVLPVIELPKLDNSAISRVDVVYNGTGVGKKSDDQNSVNESPVPSSIHIPKNIFAIDANYTPWKTKFFQQFEQSGARTTNGFSHMIAFTALHLSEILAVEVPISKVMEVGEDIMLNESC
jgi:shikimate dehydrogenase